jgi:hypothetical protein
MPANPSHDGLTAQGWNWSLSDAKTYVSTYGKLNIGQTYITSDNSTRVYISLKEGALSPNIGICVNGTITIDWGDNSATETVTGTSISNTIYTPHTYATSGDYVISISVNSGTINFVGESTRGRSHILTDGTSSTSALTTMYRCCVKKVHFGTGFKTNLTLFSAFSGCYNLENVILPKYINSVYDEAFESCYSLKFIIIPDTVTFNASGIFYNCHSLSKIVTSNTRLNGSYLCQNCYALSKIQIPEVPADISSSQFQSCYSLINITIPKSIATLGNQFTFPVLTYIKFTRSTPPSANGSNVFASIGTSCILYVPALVSNKYMTASNYPDPSTYNYIGYATYSSEDTLPTLTTDETYTLTWYATVEDAIAGTNPITEGNGNEVYSRATAVV